MGHFTFKYCGARNPPPPPKFTSNNTISFNKIILDQEWTYDFFKKAIFSNFLLLGDILTKNQKHTDYRIKKKSTKYIFQIKRIFWLGSYYVHLCICFTMKFLTIFLFFYLHFPNPLGLRFKMRGVRDW